MNRIAVIAIVVSDYGSVEKVNAVLHDARDFVIGRMGIPYKEKGINIITVSLDAPQETINSVSGKLGMISGVKSQVLITK